MLGGGAMPAIVSTPSQLISLLASNNVNEEIELSCDIDFFNYGYVDKNNDLYINSWLNAIKNNKTLNVKGFKIINLMVCINHYKSMNTDNDGGNFTIIGDGISGGIHNISILDNSFATFSGDMGGSIRLKKLQISGVTEKVITENVHFIAPSILGNLGDFLIQLENCSIYRRYKASRFMPKVTYRRCRVYEDKTAYTGNSNHSFTNNPTRVSQYYDCLFEGSATSDGDYSTSSSYTYETPYGKIYGGAMTGQFTNGLFGFCQTSGSNVPTIIDPTLYDATNNPVKNGVSATAEEIQTFIDAITLETPPVAEYFGSFRDCNSLTSIIIPASVKEIKENAFYNTALTSVTIASDCVYSDNSFPPGCAVNTYA